MKRSEIALSIMVDDVENFNSIATSKTSLASNRISRSVSNENINQILSQMKTEIEHLVRKEEESNSKISQLEQKEIETNNKISLLEQKEIETNNKISLLEQKEVEWSNKIFQLQQKEVESNHKISEFKLKIDILQEEVLEINTIKAIVSQLHKKYNLPK